MSAMWDYWCPPEGEHYIHPNELQVGIVFEAIDGEAWPLLVACVVPPLPSVPPSQNETFAKKIKETLAAKPWEVQDWLAAHGGPSFTWPEPTRVEG